ncbi:MAG: lipase [Geodermatophilaceae bacterium]|nr:lipase [Geodermatophilaceae bacterium]
MILIAALVAAALAATAVVVWRTTGASVTPVAQDRPGPVLLIPGYGGSTEALEVLAGELRASGRDATVLQLAGDGTGDLREQAQVLAAAADAAIERTGAPSVDVIGYSAGGVVARLWVRDFDGAGLARRVITLGSPHHGTRVAELAVAVVPDECPLACRQLVPDSDLLRELNAGDETPDGPAYISIWSTVDEVVTPPDSARLDGALNLVVQDICDSSQVPHGSLPTDQVVSSIVALEIGAGAPEELSAADCARLSS